MGSEAQLLSGRRLHILFFPLMAPGHMIPTLDITKLFALRGVRCTVVTTAGNAAVVRSAIKSTPGIDVHLVPFPSSMGNDGHENLSCFDSKADQIAFLCGLRDFRPLVEPVIRELRPDAVVADMFFPWATALCAELGLPRILFHGTCAFANCAMACVAKKNFQEVPPDGEAVVLLGLPHRIKLLKSQIPDFGTMLPNQAAMLKEVKEAEEGCYGVLVNSFYELEPDYARYYREVLGWTTWHVGPVSLCNHNTEDLAARGVADPASPTARRCKEWLDSKPISSVLYICFGSLAAITTAQLREISAALESTHHPFLWVVRDGCGEGDALPWLSKAIEQKQEAGECMVVRGWAPQVLILSHDSVGGFMTHCGWNSTLEAISSGVPMVTWPYFAEQHYNERLLVDVLRVGVAVGSKHYAAADECPIIPSPNIEAAIKQLMDTGEEADARRRRAKELANAARKAVMEGGSSYDDMGRLIKELELKGNQTIGCRTLHGQQSG